MRPNVCLLHCLSSRWWLVALNISDCITRQLLQNKFNEKWDETNLYLQSQTVLVLFYFVLKSVWFNFWHKICKVLRDTTSLSEGPIWEWPKIDPTLHSNPFRYIGFFVVMVLFIIMTKSSSQLFNIFLSAKGFLYCLVLPVLQLLLRHVWTSLSQCRQALAGGRLNKDHIQVQTNLSPAWKRPAILLIQFRPIGGNTKSCSSSIFAAKHQEALHHPSR